MNVVVGSAVRERAFPLALRAGAQDSSEIAETGQLSTACRQSHELHPAGSVTQALSSRSSKTLGQSSVQSPQPMHVSISTLGVTIVLAPFLVVVSTEAGTVFPIVIL